MSPQPDTLIRIPSDWKGCGHGRLRRGVSGWYKDTYDCSVPAELNRQNVKAELISVDVDPVCLGMVLPSRSSPAPGWSTRFVLLVVRALLPSATFLVPSLLGVNVPPDTFPCTGAVLSACSAREALVASPSVAPAQGCLLAPIGFLCGFFFLLFYCLPPDSDMRGALMVVLEHPSMLNLSCL